MDADREYLTQEKYDSLTAELQELKTVKRKEVAEALESAKSMGDLSENQEYQEARDNQGHLEDRINYLEGILKSATIVSTHDTGMAVVGATITVEREGSKDKKTYTLVGSEEADAGVGKISVRSPLGMSALGKKKGEVFSFQSPSGMMSYKIVDIK